MAHFTIEINITEDDFNENGKLRSDRVFGYFQNVAEGHVNSLGVGPGTLKKKNLIWVLTKMKVEYRTSITRPGRYLCTTFPASQKRATFKRDYYINTLSDGPDPDKALVVGASQWCILNFNTRKLEKTDIVFDIPEDERDMIPGVFPKIRGNSPKPLMEHQVNDGDIDYNDHCNNTRYIALSEKATGREAAEKIFVNFASETRLGDKFKICYEEQEDSIYIEGMTESGILVFQMIIK